MDGPHHICHSRSCVHLTTRRARGIPAPVTLPVLPPANENPKDSINQLAEGFVNSLQVRLMLKIACVKCISNG